MLQILSRLPQALPCRCCRRDCRSMAFPGSLHLKAVLQNVGVSCIIFHVLFVKVLQ